MTTTKIILSAFAAVAMTTGGSSAHAATLIAVPMQGGMVMPMVSYHANAGSLEVMMPPEIPQLTPLLISNPGDVFDPSDPWFDALDPTRQGQAFSRRYGFVMDIMTDPLPENATIWIRKVAGPADLRFYRYSGSDPIAWEPIFGTAGAPDAMPWNGMMFHPGVTASPGTTLVSATFELFLASTDTGEELPGTNSGPLSFNWTNVPDGRPLLDIGIKLLVAWPASTSGYLLESADSVAPTDWTIVTNGAVTIEGQPAVLLEPEAVTKLFRMRKSP